MRAGLFSGYNMMKQIKGATARIQKKDIGTVLILHLHYGYINIYLKMESPLYHDDIFVHVSFPVVHISTRQGSVHLVIFAPFEV